VNETWDQLYALAVGLGVRVGLPVLVTLLLARLLKQMDARWQAESRLLRPHSLGAQAYQIRCWEQRECPPEVRAACPAFGADRPCWQVMRQTTGRLPEACFDCEVFKDAIPVFS
jgi:hypothetical protein